MTVTVAVAYGTRARVHAVVAAERERARSLVTADPRWDTRGLSRVEAAARRAERAGWLAGLRGTGQLRDTVGALLACGVPAALAARGWDVDWPLAPPEARLPGRWPGGRDQGWAEQLTVRLPAGLVDQVVGACWWTSAEAITALRAWRDEYDHPVGDPQALRRYEALAAQVTSTGVIWRAALHQALTTTPPQSF